MSNEFLKIFPMRKHNCLKQDMKKNGMMASMGVADTHVHFLHPVYG
jgi:hypothetical protein